MSCKTHEHVKRLCGFKNRVFTKRRTCCCVEKMLKSAGYTDMGVIDELRNGTDLVGCVERTEFWPTKFQPASVTLEKSNDMASKERGGLHQQFVGVCEGDFIEQVWNKTMEEVTLVFWLVLSRLTFEPEVRHCMCLRRSLIFLACGGTTHQFSGIAAMAWIGSQLPFA